MHDPWDLDFFEDYKLKKDKLVDYNKHYGGYAFRRMHASFFKINRTWTYNAAGDLYSAKGFPLIGLATSNDNLNDETIGFIRVAVHYRDI